MNLQKHNFVPLSAETFPLFMHMKPLKYIFQLALFASSDAFVVQPKSHRRHHAPKLLMTPKANDDGLSRRSFVNAAGAMMGAFSYFGDSDIASAFTSCKYRQILGTMLGMNRHAHETGSHLALKQLQSCFLVQSRQWTFRFPHRTTRFQIARLKLMGLPSNMCPRMMDLLGRRRRSQRNRKLALETIPWRQYYLR